MATCGHVWLPVAGCHSILGYQFNSMQNEFFFDNFLKSCEKKTRCQMGFFWTNPQPKRQAHNRNDKRTTDGERVCIECYAHSLYVIKKVKKSSILLSLDFIERVCMGVYAHSLYVIKKVKKSSILLSLDYIERVCMEVHAHSLYVIKKVKKSPNQEKRWPWDSNPRPQRMKRNVVDTAIPCTWTAHGRSSQTGCSDCGAAVSGRV